MNILKATIILTLITLSCLTSFGQTKNYDMDWKQVETHMNNGLPASALEVIKKIYAKAKSDKQDAQVIKALVYMTQLKQENRERNEMQSIKELEKEIAQSKEPATSLLNSYLAGVYQDYFNRNRYKLYDRTNTVNFVKTDPETWTVDDFHKKISSLYLASLDNEKLLQQTKPEAYDALITKGNVRYLRPTLFDLLAHRALGYFQNSERDITRPAYKFEINQAEAFAPAATFVHQQFTTKDSLSLWHKALLTYQELLRFHLNDKKPDALIDADLQRLLFIKNNSTHPDKEKLYSTALKNIIQQYGNIAPAIQAQYLLGDFYWQHGNRFANEYQNKDSAYAYFQETKKITEDILVNKDSSEGKLNAYNLKELLQRRQMEFKVEKVNIPDQPFRMLIKYKNVSSIYLRIIPATTRLKKEIKNRENADTSWSLLNAAKSLLDWNQDLPGAGDMIQHSAEIKVDALPMGEYYILASVKNDFSQQNNILGMQLIYVSNISYLNQGKDFFVLNRNTGEPLPNAKVQVWQENHNYQKNTTHYTDLGKYSTDDHGHFTFEPSSKNSNYQLEITYHNEHFFMDGSNYYYLNDYDGTDEDSRERIFLFTDRGIYRPGQTVYFKGVAVKSNWNGKRSTAIANYTSTVELLDANYQKIDSIKLTTNEYGSFSGTFKLPASGLNGTYTISTDDGEIEIKMEEYKRPKFYVEFEKTKGAYQLNEKIKATGFAQSYAGNKIDGATVTYRVQRVARFPYLWLSRIFPPGGGSSMEIAHGTTTTDANGKFQISFDAIPDAQVDPKTSPVFDYSVHVDITDINGEARSGETIVSAGYQSIIIKSNIPDKTNTDSIQKIFVRTENLSGEFQKMPLQIKFLKLKPEDRLLRQRLWERPDTFTMNKTAYVRVFPNDVYNNEDKPEAWPVERTLIDQTVQTDSTGIIHLPKNPIESGFYAIELSTTDKNGKEIKDIKWIEIFENNEEAITRPQYLWTKGSNRVEPGQNAIVKIGSSAIPVFMIQKVEKGKANHFSYSEISGGIKTFSYPIKEADRGGFSVGFAFVKNNRIYQFNDFISVPWTNKELDINYETFRDKTLPGSKEKWTVKISGYKGEKVAAEMLASMYDASLDQFTKHEWEEPDLWRTSYNSISWNTGNNFNAAPGIAKNTTFNVLKYYNKNYDRFMWGEQDNLYYALEGRIAGLSVPDNSSNIRLRGISSAEDSQARLEEVVVVALGTQKKKSATGDAATIKSPKIPEDGEAKNDNIKNTPIRTNFNETAFFFPDLHTDKDGSINFSFTMPEALTRWKFQALAHTKEMAWGYSSKEIITQKDLMVQLNAPRFLREGDKLELSAKVVNLSAKEVTGIASLQLFDPATNEPVDGWFKNVIPQQYFTIAAGQSQAVNFPLEVPYQYNKALTWRIIAKTTTSSGGQAGASDGEENMLPVLTNRMLVTETLPLAMRGSGSKDFSFDKLKNSGNSETLTTQSLTVEYTSNPAWYAVQALPYMMQYPYECAEQTWNKYYANSLATLIANSSPKIKTVFDEWAKASPSGGARPADTVGRDLEGAALLSNLEKNQELKSVLLQETPWVLAVKSETQQKKNIALLFDLVRMGRELNSAYDKLQQMQGPVGAFVWFKGGRDDRYITQYIITGIGHLQKLNAVERSQSDKLSNMVNKALPYLDMKIKQEYDDLIKYKADLNKYTPSYYVVQYLYMRSFFKKNPIAVAAQKAVDYFEKRAKTTWVQQNKYMQGMVALALHREGDAATPAAILKSLKETAINNEELGMYYKDAYRGWWWYEAPIERQALIIEAFDEITKDTKTADDMRTWLLKNKQTNNWESTKATAEACYALLLRGTKWLEAAPTVEIKLGNLPLAPSEGEGKVEAGTGYFKRIISGDKVTPAMGNITVTVNDPATPLRGAGGLPTWGSVYWQYFEDLDKISFAETPLKLSKKLFAESNSDNGPVLTPVNDGDAIKVGDKIKVRVELRVDRDMEYVHMKDMRASGFEPVNVLSNYKWQGGLGYYETTKDASTNFFFNYLPKGTYVFEYSLFATMAGNFSNGITSIQCMYAPEFTSHSEGVRVTIK